MRIIWGAVAALAALGTVAPVRADVVARNSPAAGSVISRKVGEEVRFIDVSDWRGVDVKQDLLGGDVLRTNSLGHLAVLFADRTQVRLGRNTTLVVKELGAAADTRLNLQSGTIWARAERGGLGLTVETPAAAAAIRGTDWTMTVDGDKTSLIVLEGLVELSNELGSVKVAQGEAAVASIGQAPTKVVIVDPDDREQMLFYLSLRNSFGWMPVSPLSSPEMRRQRARIAGKPEANRSAEDWLTLAEVSLSYDGKAAALQAAARARGFRLTPAQKARIDLIDALAAGAAHEFKAAAQLFEKAAPRLDARRRAIALYGGYFARSLANPDHIEAPPAVSGGGPYSALAEAWTAGFLKDIPAAIAIIKRAETIYPDYPSLPAYRAQLALLIDDREQVRAAIDRSLALDPDDPTALEARANYRAGIESDLDGALTDAERAAEIAPGSTTIWNAVGLLHGARGAHDEAEAALKRSIELDPNDPVSYANLAILYLDEDRVSEAKVLIDKSLAVDPSFDIALVARGRYHLQTGDTEKAVDDLLAGSTANPAYAQALLLLSAGYYERGEREAAAQALENADRLDPNDPVTASFDTAIAIDGYDSDRAIRSAQETLHRSRARGGHYAPLSANTDAGSTLNEAFRLQGLDAWGRYYSDGVYNPFSGASQVDRAVAGSVDPFVNDTGFGDDHTVASVNSAGFSALFQGLMFSPEMISGRSRSANLFRRPFLEGAVGGGFTRTGTDWGWTSEAEIQGYFAEPIPWSIYGTVKGRETTEYREHVAPGAPVSFSSADIGFELLSGTGYITARPTPRDRVVAYIDVQNSQENYENALLTFNIPGVPFDASQYDRRIDTQSATGGMGWSHTFGYQNVLNAAVFVNDVSQTSHEAAAISLLGFPLGQQTEQGLVSQQSYLGALNHTLAVGDVTWRYGVEAGQLDVRQERRSRLQIPILGIDDIVTDIRDASVPFGRAYADVVYEVNPTLTAEAALFATGLAGDMDVQRLEPRIGLAWTPLDGHALRAGYLRETSAANATTLAPIGVVGLQTNQAPLDVGGYSDTFAARWDAQWSPRFFTALDYQHQNLHSLSIPVPASTVTADIAQARIDRVSATANAWLGYGFGAFATAAWTSSEDRDRASAGFGAALPFVPEFSGRAGITWVSPANLKVTLAATYIGERNDRVAGVELDDYWTADAFLTWEPFDKRFNLELAAYNILNETFYVTDSVPGWGPSFTGSLKVRF